LRARTPRARVRRAPASGLHPQADRRQRHSISDFRPLALFPDGQNPNRIGPAGALGMAPGGDEGVAGDDQMALAGDADGQRDLLVVAQAPVVEDRHDAPVQGQAPRDGFGAYAQASWLMPWWPLELSLRYAGVRRSDQTSSLPEADEVTAGAGVFFEGHDLKLQADYSRLWSEGPDAARHRFRLQLQAAL